MQPDGAVVDLFGLVDPIYSRLIPGAVFLRRNKVERVDHVVHGQRGSVMKADARTNYELVGRVVHGTIGFGDQRADLSSLRILIQQAVVEQSRQDETLASGLLVVVKRGHL